MNAPTCRYDAKHGHLTRLHWPACRTNDCPGCLPCTHDEHGHEIRHCESTRTDRDGTVKWRCTSHLATNETRTCSACIAKVRRDLTDIETRAALMLPEAIIVGIESEAANLAGPAPHPGVLRARRIFNRKRALALPTETQIIKALEAIPDDDPHHPFAVLTRWELEYREAYNQPTTLVRTIARARSYLEGILNRIAQDTDQDFAQFAAEIATCRSHLDAVARDSRAPERGAPCPLCEIDPPNLVLRRAHWCDNDDCEREHHDTTGALDTWVCPRNREHWWREADYRMYVAWEAKSSRPTLTSSEMTEIHGIPAGTLRRWVHEKKVEQRGKDKSGRVLYDVEQALALRAGATTPERIEA